MQRVRNQFREVRSRLQNRREFRKQIWIINWLQTKVALFPAKIEFLCKQHRRDPLFEFCGGVIESSKTERSLETPLRRRGQGNCKGYLVLLIMRRQVGVMWRDLLPPGAGGRDRGHLWFANEDSLLERAGSGE